MSRILKMLEQFNDNVTVGQVIKTIKADQKERVLEETYRFDALKEEYNHSYLKVIEEDGLFGRTLYVYYIEELTSKEKTTDWENIYFIKGKKVGFDSTQVSEHIMDGESTYYTLSEQELKAMEKIPKEKFEQYVFKYNCVKDKLTKIIE